MNYTILPEAKQDLMQSIEWYRERGDHLALDFSNEVYAAIERICLNPEAWQFYTGSVRRVRLNHFPHGVFYVIHDGCVQIVAIMHLHRDPDSWKHRLRKRA